MKSAEHTHRVKICSQCILPETFPGIGFDSDGVCSHCRRFREKKTCLDDEKRKYGQKFADLLLKLGIQASSSQTAARSSYDVLMAYSGGKDSTYTMGLLKNKYGLRIMAVSFDNGFVSERAVANIRNATDALGIDHIFFKPKWDVLKRVFKAAEKKELYSKKALERASTMCTSCIGIIKSLCLKMAIEMDIPMVGYGWSPGQAPIQSSIMKNNPSLVKMAQKAIFGPLREVVGDGITIYALQERHYADPGKFPYNIHPMAWEFYDEGMIIGEIQKYGWKMPEDTDTNSTNCLLNSFANSIHIEKYGFHPYVWEIANMVREGVMDRKSGYEKIYAGQNPVLVEAARKKLEE